MNKVWFGSGEPCRLKLFKDNKDIGKYRILKREYPNGQKDYEVQKKILGLFWWNFENVDSYTTGIYTNLEDAEKAIKMNKEKPKITIIEME